MAPFHTLADWAARLRWEEVPAEVREHAVDQVLSMLAAVFSGWDSDLGPLIDRAFPPTGEGRARESPGARTMAPSQAALRMAAWSMVLDYDDVMLGGHTGHSAVLVPWALAEAGGHAGHELLLAQVVANELAARINMVCAVGATRGQMATHLHLLGAAAAKAKLQGDSAETFAAALGFALSYPAQALFPAFLGSDAKVLAAAWPVRMGMEAVDAVRAGLRPAADLLDDPRGFFATHAHVPVREFLGGLGERWHTATNSYKIYPACGYICAALDATLDLAREHRVAAEDVAAVDVWSSIFTVGVDAHSAPFLDAGRTPIAAATFSTPFLVAAALVAGELGPAQLRRSALADPRVWRLAARVRSRHDLALSLRALTADIPLGAALRRVPRLQAALFGWGLAKKGLGPRGRWRHPLQTLGLMLGLARAAGERGALDLTRSTKPLGARVVLHLTDGRQLERTVEVPRGFAGWGGDTRALLRRKLHRAAATILGDARAAELVRRVEALATASPAEVKAIFDLCQGAARSTTQP